MSDCTEYGGGYKLNYAAALRSAPHDVLLPVLMLSRYGLTPNPELSAFGRWAQAEGAHVIEVDSLSFQKDLTSHFSHLSHRGWGARQVDHITGPFLRLDIPRMVSEHSLFSLPCACPEYALYTDTDVMFGNVTAEATAQALHGLAKYNGDRFVMYGAEHEMHGPPKNTGVFFMSVSRFERAWPEILKVGLSKSFRFPERAYDQGWLNFYFNMVKAGRNSTMLPLAWNWKVYWAERGQSLSAVRIIHFHGPKAGSKYLACLASQDRACVSRITWQNYTGSDKRFSMDDMVRLGFANNGGRMANATLLRYLRLLPPTGAFCTNTSFGAPVGHLGGKTSERASPEGVDHRRSYS